MAREFSDILDVELFGSFFKENHLKNPTDVQTAAISPFVAGKSVQVLAKTGSGKTYSYLLPLFQMLKVSEDKNGGKSGAPRAIIVVPIKELATQVHNEAKKLSHHIKLRVRVALGGDKGASVQSLKKTPIDILIGGPGRIKSMLDKGEISLENLDYFIIDEADQLMDMGFMVDMKGIRKHIKRPYQAGLYSATSSETFENLRMEFFSGISFENVNVGITNALVSKIDTFNITLNYQEKKAMLETFLNKEAKGMGVIFVNQKETVVEIYEFMRNNFKNIKTSCLHGDMSAADRKSAFENFRNAGGILVTSDIIARGVDIKGLLWILNYDLPFEAVYYVHRSGRVGRNGAYGKVYNFVTSKDVPLISRINEAISGQTALKIDAITIKKTAFAKGGVQKSAKDVKKVERRDTKPKRTPRFAKKTKDAKVLKTKREERELGVDKTRSKVSKKVTPSTTKTTKKKVTSRAIPGKDQKVVKKVRRHVNKRT